MAAAAPIFRSRPWALLGHGGNRYRMSNYRAMLVIVGRMPKKPELTSLSGGHLEILTIVVKEVMEIFSLTLMVGPPACHCLGTKKLDHLQVIAIGRPDPHRPSYMETKSVIGDILSFL
jgi:hypothetical protein